MTALCSFARRSAAAVLVLDALFGGCTLLSPYPSPGDETCGNEIDDDLDGLVDCNDTPCLGTEACPEDALSLCLDGRDNDGDGRTDFEDATCWPDGVVTIERCASILGGAVSSDRWTGDVTLVADPVGEHDGPVSAVGIGAGDGAVAARSTVALTGALDGLGATIEIYLPRPAPAAPPLDGILIWLLPVGTVRSAPYAAYVRIEIGLGGEELIGTVGVRTPTGLTEGSGATNFGTIGAWSPIQLNVIDGLFVASRAGEVSDGERDQVSLPAGFPSDTPVTIAATGSAFGVAGTVTPLVGTATLSRGTRLRCEDVPAVGTTPPIGIVPELGVDVSYHWLAAITRSRPGSSCALVYSGPDDLPALEALGEVGGEWSSSGAALGEVEHSLHLPDVDRPPDVDGAALAYDEATETIYAAVTTGRLDPVTSVYEEGVQFLHAAAGCSDWRDDGWMAFPRIPRRVIVRAPPVAYEVVGGTHVLRVATMSDVELYDGLDVRTLQASMDRTGTLRAFGIPDTSLFGAVEASVPPGEGPIVDMPRLGRIGSRDEVAVVRRGRGHIELWAQRGTRWLRVPGVDVGPSAEEGSFDADALVIGELVEDSATPGAWSGRLLYTGIYDAGRAVISGGGAGGFGPLRVRIAAPGFTP